MNTLTRSIVVFSQNYLPLNRISLKRAVILLVTGKAEPIDFLSNVIWEVRSPNFILQVPAYIRMPNAKERIWQVPSVSRRELLRRDRYQCQYCGSRKDLTIDHIIPRCQGGKHSWNNVVTACAPCNNRKGNQTPEQASMKLANKPKAPTNPAVAFAEFWQELNSE